MAKWICDAKKAANVLGICERRFRDFADKHSDELKPVVFRGSNMHTRYFWLMDDLLRVKRSRKP